MSDCIECKKFGLILIAIKKQLQAGWGDTTNPKFAKFQTDVLQIYVPGAIKRLEEIRAHCQKCVDQFDRIHKGSVNLGIMSTDVKAEKIERDRHQNIINRCSALEAKLEACRHYGKKNYLSVCWDAIKDL